MNGECEGYPLSSGKCEGAIAKYRKEAMSFGRAFVTHAMMCKTHADLLGFKEGS